MGAVFETLRVYKDTREEAREECQRYISDCQWEYGHGGYSGTFAEATGVIFTDRTFTHRENAYDYLIEKAEKWGPAVGVLVDDEEEAYYLFGAWCSE